MVATVQSFSLNYAEAHLEVIVTLISVILNGTLNLKDEKYPKSELH